MMRHHSNPGRPRAARMLARSFALSFAALLALTTVSAFAQSRIEYPPVSEPSRGSARTSAPVGASRRGAPAIPAPVFRDRSPGIGGTGFREKQKAGDDFENSELARRPRRDVVGEPWLGPDGSRLVAVVGDRFLTKPDLDQRVRIALQGAPPITALDPREKAEMLEARHVETAATIMEEWVETTALSLEAERQGHKVTREEIEKTLADLGQEATAGGQGDASRRAVMLGISEAVLRQEIRDGLLVEKFVLDVVRQYDRSVYRQVFDAEPANFLIPPRVRAFHVFRQFDGSMTTKQRKEIQSDLEKIRKELTRKSPDYQKLVGMSDPGDGIAVGDMGWVQADTPILPELHRALFGLSPGEVSPVFKEGTGLHIVKVLEREEGSGTDFEAAIPQIENYLFGRTKGPLFEAIKGRYTIRMNSGGLTRWREVAGSGGASPGAEGPAGASSGTPSSAGGGPASATPMAPAEPRRTPSSKPPEAVKSPAGPAPTVNLDLLDTP